MAMTLFTIGSALGILGVFASTVAAFDWACTRKDIEEKDGNICCNKEVERRLRRLLDNEENLHHAAVGIRNYLERAFGGSLIEHSQLGFLPPQMRDCLPDHWEAIVSYNDFGYASYRQGLFHCKYTASNGRAAMVWKVFNAMESKKKSEEVDNYDSFFEEEDRIQRKKEQNAKTNSRSASKTKRRKLQTASKARSTTQTPQEPKRLTLGPTPKTNPTSSTTTTPTTTSSKRKLTANEQLWECCQSNRDSIPASCYNGAGGNPNLCNYNSLNGPDLIRVYLTKSCPSAALAAILNCASKEEDHRPCCDRRNVPGFCHMFCNPKGGLSEPSAQQLSCVNVLSSIRECFVTYADTGILGRN